MKYFSEREVRNLDPFLVEMLDVARGKADVPFKINSGFRTKARNRAVGGVKDSSHLTGNAVDINARGNDKRFKIVKALLEVGFNRIGIGETFVHADISKNKSNNVIWTY